MRMAFVVAGLLGGALILAGWRLNAADGPGANAPAGDVRLEAIHKPFGLDKRVPWTTSKIIGSPEPPPPYQTERVFAKLRFEEPLDLTFAPGTNRLFVAERWGKIYSFVNKPDVAKADLALEFTGFKDSKGQPAKQVIYAFTIHPKFKDNGYLFVTWIPNPEVEGLPRGSRVSRFTVTGEPPVIDRASEKVVFEWPNGGHNGGCLRFGPDGHLYIVTGDGSGIADASNIGQDLSSIHAKLLRIDVDQPETPAAGAAPSLAMFCNRQRVAGPPTSPTSARAAAESWGSK